MHQQNTTLISTSTYHLYIQYLIKWHKTQQSESVENDVHFSVLTPNLSCSHVCTVTTTGQIKLLRWKIYQMNIICLSASTHVHNLNISIIPCTLFQHILHLQGAPCLPHIDDTLSPTKGLMSNLNVPTEPKMGVVIWNHGTSSYKKHFSSGFV